MKIIFPIKDTFELEKVSVHPTIIQQYEGNKFESHHQFNLMRLLSLMNKSELFGMPYFS